MSIPNRIAGCLYGYAIGNALGLGTEFMTRDEIAHRYPDGLHDYKDIIRDSHRSAWARGAFTDDTELTLMLIDSILSKGRPDYRHYAVKLKDWFENTSAINLDHEMRWILSDEDFVDNPHDTAQRIHARLTLPIASNEHLGRAMVLGIWGGKDMEQNVLDNCNLTNCDPKCHATSLVIASVARQLLWYRHEPVYEHLWGICQRVAPGIIPFLEIARDGRIEDLDLDNETTYMSTVKAMCAALWAMWHYKDPMEAVDRVIHEGGDSDTNGALTLGLFGLKYGVNRLPGDKIENLVGRERVSDIIVRFVPAVETLIEGDKDDDEK